MIGIVISPHWDRYYASSPFRNMLEAKHPEFAFMPRLPHETDNEDFRFLVNECDALICDDVLIQSMSWYTKGPKFMIGGDPHAHKPDQVERLEKEYAACDYVLTGAVFSKKLLDRYLYPKAEVWNKHIYFPHYVADKRPRSTPYTERKPKALISGSVDAAVYPYRARVKEFVGRDGSWVESLSLNEMNHETYFEHIARYKAAVTCNSIFEYTVAKYFEIPWMASILLAPKCSNEEAELIGFEDGVNVFWCASADDVPGIAKAVVSDDFLYEPIALNGAALMQNHHTLYQRLDYIAKLVDRIKQGNFVPEDAKDCFLNHRKGVANAGLARDVAR